MAASSTPQLLLTSLREQTAQATVSTRIRLRLPRRHYSEPILSHLICRYEVTVNVQGALLTAGRPDDGWFDLRLDGAANNISDALLYLLELEADIWVGFEPDSDF
ncbi:MAG TPA: NIL domain-containing protein [Candidatus Obscuribacterales bacterium]